MIDTIILILAITALLLIITTLLLLSVDLIVNIILDTKIKNKLIKDYIREVDENE